MANRSTVISRTPTNRPDYVVKTTVWYNESRVRRGYFARISIVKLDGDMELQPLFGRGLRSVFLEPANRFSEKQFDNLRLALAIGGAFPDVDAAIASVLEEAPSINF